MPLHPRLLLLSLPRCPACRTVELRNARDYAIMSRAWRLASRSRPALASQFNPTPPPKEPLQAEPTPPTPSPRAKPSKSRKREAIPLSSADVTTKLPKVFKQFEQPPDPHLIRVSIVGPANAGKSTLLNRLVGDNISPVTERPQTTRERIVGVLTEGNKQIVFLDTPGIIPGKNIHRYNRELINSSWHSLKEADHVLIMVDAQKVRRSTFAEDYLFQRLSGFEVPATLVFNKMDTVEDRAALEPITAKFQTQYPYIKRVLFISARENVDPIKDALVSEAKPGNWIYPSDARTDLADLKRVENVVRAELFKRLSGYLPYIIKQENIGWLHEKGRLRIDQLLYVDRGSQEKIVVGAEGRVIKEVTLEARKQLSEIFHKPVQLFLQVKSRK
ncbi:uncharacterized protein VTP21DRAFT_1451 [Calcarisporiella thermophila]|uniref:uncharacterized protein n=1 Tax=Calcarisporiella thermophila TaxID=911321 RepID=UPI003743D9BF